MAVCTAITGSGTRCKGIAIDSSGLCHAHHPDRAEARSRAARRGGKRGGRGRPMAEVSDVKDLLRKLAEDVLEGSVSRAEAAGVSQIWNTFLRALAIEAKLREDAELAQEVAEIHDALRARKERRWAFGNN
jgi:hypothetical protein